MGYSKNEIYHRVATPRIEYEEFKSEIDELTHDYAVSDNDSEKLRIKTRIIDLYFSEDGSIEYYWYKFAGKTFNNNEDPAEQFYLERFSYVLDGCLNNFKEGSTLFRTYFETSIRREIKKIISSDKFPNVKKHDGKRSVVIMDLDEEIENNKGEKIPRGETISNEDVNPGYSSPDEEAELRDSVNALLLKYVIAILNFYETAGNTERIKNKKRQLSTIHTRVIIDILRKVDFQSIATVLYKNEWETLRSLNGDLIKYTYLTKIRDLYDLSIMALKPYSSFKNVIKSHLTELDSEIETPFELFIIVNFFNDIYNKTVSDKRVSQMIGEYRDFLKQNT